MQKAVMNVMEQYATKWQPIPEMQHKYDLFVHTLKKIDDHMAILGKDPEPLKVKRDQSRTGLVERLFPVTSVMAVLASDLGDKKIGVLTGARYNDLEKMDQDVLVKYCTKILKVSGRMLAQQPVDGKKSPGHMISGYGLTTGHLEGLQAALDKFTRDAKDYSDLRLQQKKSKLKLDSSIRANNRLLKSKLDRMIHLFRETQPAFYKAYIKARLPVAKTAIKTTPVAKTATTPDQEDKPDTAASKKSSVSGSSAATGKTPVRKTPVKKAPAGKTPVKKKPGDATSGSSPASQNTP